MRDRIKKRKTGLLKSSEAFSFAEMLLVVSLMGLVLLSVFTALSNGLGIWKRMQESTGEESALIFLEQVTADLRNALNNRALPLTFEGRQDSLVFSTLVRTAGDERTVYKGEWIDQIGLVEYRYDPVKNSILRVQSNYGQAVSGQKGYEREALKDVWNFRVRYLYRTTFGLEWEDRSQDVIPASVRVILEFGGPGERKVWKKFINMPVGFGYEDDKGEKDI